MHTPESARTAEEAAATVGTSVSQIVKSLIFLCDGAPVIALVSGSNRLDTKALGALAGGRIERADANAARDATGFAIGGIPPIGHPAPIPTWIDRDLLGLDVVWAAAGRRTRSFRSRRPTSSGPATAIVADIKASSGARALATPRSSSRMPKVMPQTTSSLPRRPAGRQGPARAAPRPSRSSASQLVERHPVGAVDLAGEHQRGRIVDPATNAAMRIERPPTAAGVLAERPEQAPSARASRPTSSSVSRRAVAAARRPAPRGGRPAGSCGPDQGSSGCVGAAQQQHGALAQAEHHGRRPARAPRSGGAGARRALARASRGRETAAPRS